MPELPDVEIFKQYFQATSLHQEIRNVEVQSTDLLEGVTAKHLRQVLPGTQFTAVDRHGKYLLVQVAEKGWLILHFGMTGFLKYFKNDDQMPDHVRFLTEFANGYCLAYDCARKLGQINWTTDRKEFIAGQKLGPDVLSGDFNESVFRKILENRHGLIKGLLMNQQALAGIGNVYSDEILFQAGIHPKHKVSTLEESERRALYLCLNEVLKTAVEQRVGEKGWPEDWLLPVRSKGQACPRCDGTIRRLKVVGRSSYFCDAHQS